MSFEDQSQERIPRTVVRVEPEFENIVPDAFRNDPFTYFEQHGKNIKAGEKKLDESGAIKEDPTATKDLPVWRDGETQEMPVVGKRVNIEKSQVKKTGDPFHEYRVLEIAREFNLPAAKPIAKVSRGGEHLIIMQRIDGMRWTDEGMSALKQAKLTESERSDLLEQVQKHMAVLQEKFAKVGLQRTWKLKDMVFEIDIPGRKVITVIPTDWERTKIDEMKLNESRAANA